MQFYLFFIVFCSKAILTKTTKAARARQMEALAQENRAFAARIEKFEETTVASMQKEIDALKCVEKKRELKTKTQ